MIQDNERLIVVLGMVHSGTTILTHLLSQHPSVTLGLEPDGNELNWSLENRWTVLGESQPIEKLFQIHDRVLLKSIWYSWWSPNFLVSECPDAKFLYIQKPFDSIRESWMKSKSLADDVLRCGDEAFQRQSYEAMTEAARSFAVNVVSFKEIAYDDLLANPRSFISGVADWLDLSEFEFDTSYVSSEIDIKQILGRKL